LARAILPLPVRQKTGSDAKKIPRTKIPPFLVNFGAVKELIRNNILKNQDIIIGACYAFNSIKAYQNNCDTDKLSKQRRHGQ
jgi:hypothetical protein